MTLRLRSLLPTVLLAEGMLVAGHARAVTYGCITGYLVFYQNQGNYCPSSRTCDGAIYPQSQYHSSSQPLMHTWIGLKDLDGNLLGEGTVSDPAAGYKISWYSEEDAAIGFITTKFRHWSNTFKIKDPTSHQYYYKGSNFNLTNGRSCSDPQSVSAIYIGDANNPNRVANVYDGAWRTWHYAFAYISYLQDYFTNIEVRAFSDSPCDRSCWEKDTGIVWLDANDNTPYAYSARIAHEFGHAASDKISQEQNANSCANYDYGGDPAWNMTTQEEEWSCASYEEAFATMQGDAARYFENAADSADICPHTNLACTMLAEPSTHASGGSCDNTGDEEGRWPRSAYKFLWDVYDSGEDNEQDNGGYGELTENHHYFAPGTGECQRDEPDANPHDWDGKGPYDYKHNYYYRTDPHDSIYYSYHNNCSPPGDE